MSAPRLFHIAVASEWEAGGAGEPYRAPSLAREGFVHCSLAEQVARVAERRFRGRRDLLLLEIDAERLAVPLRFENLEGGSEAFPHVYGPIPRAAVCAVHPFAPAADGRFAEPASRTVRPEVLLRRDGTWVHRSRLEPGEATPWHRDACHRVTVVLCGGALEIEYADGGAPHRVPAPAGVDWEEPEPRMHRARNVGATPFEEVVVFLLVPEGELPQPGPTGAPRAS